MADNKQITRRISSAAEYKQAAFINIEILFGKHDTLLMQARRINQRLMITVCPDERRALEIKGSFINRQRDEVAGLMHEYFRKVNNRAPRTSDFWGKGYEETFTLGAGSDCFGAD